MTKIIKVTEENKEKIMTVVEFVLQQTCDNHSFGEVIMYDSSTPDFVLKDEYSDNVFLGIKCVKYNDRCAVRLVRSDVLNGKYTLAMPIGDECYNNIINLIKLYLYRHYDNIRVIKK